MNSTQLESIVKSVSKVSSDQKLNKKQVSELVNYMFDQESIRNPLVEKFGLSKSEVEQSMNKSIFVQLMMIMGYGDQLKESLLNDFREVV